VNQMIGNSSWCGDDTFETGITDEVEASMRISFGKLGEENSTPSSKVHLAYALISCDSKNHHIEG
jgi:hypothetical protein